MNLKALFAALALSLMASVAFAADKIELKAGVDAEVKAAIESAKTANDAAKKASFEWSWGGKPAGKHLEDAIKAANDGKKEDAIKLAKKIETAGIQGQEQAEKAKTAGPVAK